jgi:ABC-type phosphate transport system permease subunit
MTRRLNVNWFGISFGVLMLILPFAGYWWRAEVGRGAASLSISPFNFDVNVVGVQIQSTLLYYILLFTKISFLIAGVFAILGSLFADRWWANRLIRFGVMKPFWNVITLVVVLMAGTFFVNMALPGIVSWMVKEGTSEIQLRMPFLSGTSESLITVDGSTVRTTLKVGFQMPLVLAIVVAALGILTKIYQKRFAKEEPLRHKKE